ncbi:outer membrane protein [Solitalea canadensis DSM 3403]|uniref:Outer membrane protein n=2 Tax=Solitalea canadensis TaxID=995 RepID=H8KUT6_SOLCM|nr:outer membrane protein [Solitalea canadensis DSM 3403]
MEKWRCSMLNIKYNRKGAKTQRNLIMQCHPEKRRICKFPGIFVKDASYLSMTSIWLFIILTGFALTANAQSVVPLRAVLDSITANNPGLQKFEYSTKANIEMGNMSKAWDAPTIAVGLDEFPYPSEMQMDGAARKMFMVNVDQMLPNFANQKAKSEYYKSFRNQNQNDYETLKNKLFAQAKAAYYTELISVKRLKVIEEQSKMLELLIKIAEARLQYSQSDLPTIYNAKAKISSLESMKIKEESMIKQSRSTLNYLMGRPLTDDFKVDTSLALNRYTEQISQYDTSFVMHNRSDIQRMSNDIASMRLNQKVAQTMAKPMFGFGFKNMRMQDGTYMYSAMASMKLPIVPWASKGYKSEVKAIDYEIKAMERERTNMVRETSSMIKNTMLDLQAQYREVDVYEKRILPDYKKTFDVNLNAFGENKGDIFRTLMAWDDLLMKRMDYLNVLDQTYKMEVMYEEAIQK